ncbi:MAG TPA: sigma-70 family RNA polymerase sigma factor [Acidothermaceae bacterium]
MPQRETAELLVAARAGDSDAWDELVERYARLVWAVARGFALSMADAADVSQTTWLRLVEHLDELREPEHVGGWLATTARRECLRILRRNGREVVGLDAGIEIEAGEPTPEAVVLDTERDRILWLSLGEISQRCQVLLRALATVPPPSYQDISAALGMPVGSIGPTRARCLDHLKRRVEVHSGRETEQQTGGGA